MGCSLFSGICPSDMKRIRKKGKSKQTKTLVNTVSVTKLARTHTEVQYNATARTNSNQDECGLVIEHNQFFNLLQDLQYLNYLDDPTTIGQVVNDIINKAKLSDDLEIQSELSYYSINDMKHSEAFKIKLKNENALNDSLVLSAASYSEAIISYFIMYLFTKRYMINLERGRNFKNCPDSIFLGSKYDMNVKGSDKKDDLNFVFESKNFDYIRQRIQCPSSYRNAKQANENEKDSLELSKSLSKSLSNYARPEIRSYLLGRNEYPEFLHMKSQMSVKMNQSIERSLDSNWNNALKHMGEVLRRGTIIDIVKPESEMEIVFNDLSSSELISSVMVLGIEIPSEDWLQGIVMSESNYAMKDKFELRFCPETLNYSIVYLKNDSYKSTINYLNDKFLKSEALSKHQPNIIDIHVHKFRGYIDKHEGYTDSSKFSIITNFKGKRLISCGLRKCWVSNTQRSQCKSRDNTAIYTQNFVLNNSFEHRIYWAASNCLSK